MIDFPFEHVLMRIAESGNILERNVLIDLMGTLSSESSHRDPSHKTSVQQVLVTARSRISGL